MKYVGVDLHKKSISICVVSKVAGKRKVLERQRFGCTGRIVCRPGSGLPLERWQPARVVHYQQGSRLLRWALVEAAWRLVHKYGRWRSIFERLCRNTGSQKKAIVGTARRLLCVMFAMLRSGQAYRLAV